MAKYGPCGGQGGAQQYDYDASANQEVGSITIWGGHAIDAIQLFYRDKGATGPGLAAPKVGGDGGNAATLELQPGEYLRAIVGRCNVLVDYLLVLGSLGQSLAVGTDYNEDKNFFLESDGNQEITGIFGRCGNLLDNLGVYMRSRER